MVRILQDCFVRKAHIAQKCLNVTDEKRSHHYSAFLLVENTCFK